MSEKSCENCKETEKDTQGSDMCNCWCNKNNGFKDWQPDYLTLEAQLSETQTKLSLATELLKDYPAQILAYREALTILYNMVYDALSTNGMAWDDVQAAKRMQDFIDNALSGPAPIDQEKEQLKEALRLACKYIFEIDFPDIKDTDLQKRKDIDTWMNHFISKAQSKQ